MFFSLSGVRGAAVALANRGIPLFFGGGFAWETVSFVLGWGGAPPKLDAQQQAREVRICGCLEGSRSSPPKKRKTDKKKTDKKQTRGLAAYGTQPQKICAIRTLN